MKKSINTEGVEIGTKSKLPCFVCEKSKKTNTVCKTCKETFCLSHSTILSPINEERICEKCFEDYLLESLPDRETIITEIGENIQSVINEREKNTKELCKISASFMYRQKAITQNEDKFQEDEYNLNENIKLLKEKFKNLEETIEKKKNSIERIKNEIEYANSKTKETIKSLEKSSEILKNHTYERNNILNELNELREFIKMQVPIRLLKRIACPMCYTKVNIEYQKVFRAETLPTILPELKRSLAANKPKESSCRSCILF